MNNNPLLQKINSKFNPDVLGKYEQMKRMRGSVVQKNKTNQPFKTVVKSEPKIDIKNVNQSRQNQDMTFSQIFSKANYMKNKLIYENRTREVQTIATKLGANQSSFQQLKSQIK